MGLFQRIANAMYYYVLETAIRNSGYSSGDQFYIKLVTNKYEVYIKLK